MADGWRPNGLFSFSDRTGVLAFEPGPGGRLVETYADGDSFAVGHIRVRESSSRLVLSWRQASFAPDQETEQHIRFDEIDDGPAGRPVQTRVTVEHIGWGRLPPEHAARHGFPPAPSQLRFAAWWQALSRALARIAAADR